MDQKIEKLLSAPITKKDFCIQADENLKILNNTADLGWMWLDIIFYCEELRKKYLETNNSEYLIALLETLPRSYIWE